MAGMRQIEKAITIRRRTRSILRCTESKIQHHTAVRSALVFMHLKSGLIRRGAGGTKYPGRVTGFEGPRSYKILFFTARHTQRNVGEITFLLC